MIKFIFLSFLSFISCKYQDDPKLFQAETFETKEPVINEATFNETLQEYFDRYVVIINQDKFDTRVDYRKLSNDIKNEDAEYIELKASLDSFIASNALNSMNLKEKIAFMTNVYNYEVIEFIGVNYPINQILEIPQNFNNNFIKFAGETISLNILEKNKLNSLLNQRAGGSKTDARIHFALICGALGCPILSNKVYQAQTLDQQLDDITRKAFELEDGRIVKKVGNSYELVELFSTAWYEVDFKNHSTPNFQTNNVIDFINHFSNFNIRSNDRINIPNDYDWDLNGL